MDRETLYDLRALLALYPYYQTARLLMLKNLYLLHDPSFDEELRRAAIYISDRKVIFQMIEAAHYQLKRTQNKPQGMGILDAKRKKIAPAASSTTSSTPSLPMLRKTRRRKRNANLHQQMQQ